MQKAEIISKIAQESGLIKKDVGSVIDAYHNVMIEALKEGDSIRLVGVGTLAAVERSARTGKNPQTGEVVIIPASIGVKFKVASTLKDALNKK